MNNADIIKEFLVGVGFHVDEASFKKFNGALAKAAEPVIKLGVVIATTVGGIETGVARIATRMESLYWVSQRTGATVTNLKALGYAASQIGLTAEQAHGAIENLARTMRMNPGAQGLLHALGVQTEGRDTTKIMTDLVGQLKKLPFYVAAQYGQMLGIDPDTLLMLEKSLDTVIQKEAEYRRMQGEAGLDTDDLSVKSKNFMNDLRDLEMRFGIIAELIERNFLPAADHVVHWAIDLADYFIKLDKATNGWSTTLGTVAVSAIGAWVTKALLLRSIFRKTVAEAGAEAAAAEGAAAAGGAAAGAGATAGGAVLGGLLRFLGPLGAFLATMHPTEANAGEDEYVKQRNAEWEAGKNLPSSTNLPRGLRNNNPGNLRQWGSTPREEGYAKFSTPLDGLRAMASNLLGYARQGYDTIKSIINRWAPSSENNTMSYIADVVKRTGFSAMQHLDLMNPETLRTLMSAMIMHENGKNPYTPEMINKGIAAARGPSAVINQHTEINVGPQTNAGATADAVAAKQDQVNGNLVRNTVGALR